MRARARAVLAAAALLGGAGLGLGVSACSASDGGAATSSGPVRAPPPADAGDDVVVASDGPCAPGEMALPDGTCRGAGASAACGAGFTSDGNGGCDVVLPATACPRGQLAYPGETVCHDVAPCGSGAWGDVPVDATTVFVDGSYAGTDSDGTSAKPWPKVSQAIAAAQPGATIAIAAGSYQEFVAVTKPVTLWGKCPAEVEIRSTPTAPTAIAVRGARGVVIRDLAVTGPAIAVLASDALDLHLTELWVHDLGDMGLAIGRDWGPTSAVYDHLLVEGVTGAGAMMVLGADLKVDHTVIRDVAQKNHIGGRAIDGEVDTDTNTLANVQVSSVVVERVADVGIFGGGGTLSIESTVVRDVAAAGDGTDGRGIEVQPMPAAGAATKNVRTALKVRGTLVQRAHDTGVCVIGSDMDIEGLIVRDMLPQVQTNGYGRGVQIEIDDGTSERSQGTLRWSLIEKGLEGGVSVLASDATFEGLWVRDTLGRADGHMGVGMGVQRYEDVKDKSVDARSHVTLRGSRIERSRVIGLLAAASDLVVEDDVVRDTVAQSDGKYGDGIAVVGGQLDASLVVKGTRVLGNARAGIANFGSTAHVASTSIGCNSFDLDGEPLDGIDFGYTDDGGNACGCGASTVHCTVLSAYLSPPTALK